MVDRSRATTGRPELDELLVSILDEAGMTRNRDQLFEAMVSVIGMGLDDASRLDLKITNAAVTEMREAFRVFAPYHQRPKVTIFGSARTLPDDPLYVQTRSFAKAVASRGWMVVTGAGPGIMAAGMEGAGTEQSLGVNIRLPFEQGANAFIAEDEKLVEMKYFFTRKLMLVKESDGFVVLPGGFGTLDELLELLTLLQTGKAEPTPLVLLEVPGGTYWHQWREFVNESVASRGLISPEDDCLYRVVDDVEDAVAEVLGFYRNFHSRRFVGPDMVVRLQVAPTDDELAALNEEFGDLCTEGSIERTEPTGAERATKDNVELPRLKLRFDVFKQSRLRLFIDALNSLPSAPEIPAQPVETAPFRRTDDKT